MTSEDVPAMTEAEASPVDEVFNEPGITELDLLKQQADRLGIRYSARIGVERLKEKIAAALSDESADSEEDASDGENEESGRKISERERQIRLREKMMKDEMRLVRVRIANLNPAKKDLAGEIFTVANKYVGIVRKFIPYGEATDNGYHIPYILYKQLKSQKFLSIKVVRKNGQMLPEHKWVPEFAIEELPPLTEHELAQLAAQQRAAQGLE